MPPTFDASTSPLLNGISGGPVLRWEPERGTRIAVIPRDGSSPTRWIATEAFWVWHFANAFEDVDDDGVVTIVVDYPHWSELPLGGAQPVSEPAAVLRLPQRVPFGLHGCWVPSAG